MNRSDEIVVSAVYVVLISQVSFPESALWRSSNCP